MKTLSRVACSAALLFLCSGTGFAANAASAPNAGKAPQPVPAAEFARPAPDFPPPPRAPIYEASLQSRQPDQALNKLIANAPQGEEGRRYEVWVMVRELPPEPAAPAKAAQ